MGVREKDGLESEGRSLQWPAKPACNSYPVSDYPCAELLHVRGVLAGGEGIHRSTQDTRPPLGSLSSTAYRYLWHHGAIAHFESEV